MTDSRKVIKAHFCIEVLPRLSPVGGRMNRSIHEGSLNDRCQFFVGRNAILGHILNYSHSGKYILINPKRFKQRNNIAVNIKYISHYVSKLNA